MTFRLTRWGLITVLSLLGNTVLLTLLLSFAIQPELLTIGRSQVKAMLPRQKPPVLSKVLNEFPGSATQSGLVDQVREFIFSNSIQKEGTDYHKKALRFENRFSVLEDIFRFSDQAGSPPELSCTPRSWAMAEVLEELGLEWRIVSIYFPGDDDVYNFSSHTFVEFFNRDTHRWEAHDPTFSTFYVDSEGNRLSSVDLHNRDPRSVRVLDKNGVETADYRMFLDRKGAFQAILLRYLGKDRRQDIFLVDDGLFNPKELEPRFPKVLMVSY